MATGGFDGTVHFWDSPQPAASIAAFGGADTMADMSATDVACAAGSYLIFASESDAAREPRIADEGRKLADHLATPEWIYQLFPLPFLEACCFLDESTRCTIYEGRPDVCRAFAAGGDQCQAARAMHAAAGAVPPQDAGRVGTMTIEVVRGPTRLYG